MTTLDWVGIAIYMLGMIALSIYLGRGQQNQDDYYVGGRNLPWWAVGISTMATQSSANSFLGIPAYVALRDGGGLTWLQYELAVPLAMIFIMIFLIPFFRKLQLVSVYEYLELRFGPGTRYLMSAVFLISRGLATGIGLYTIALLLTVILGIALWQAILLIGIVTVIYDAIGGMAAVVYSDVIQMLVLTIGLLLLIYYCLADPAIGSLSEALTIVPPERLEGTQFTTGLGDGGSSPFWGFLLGGFFLYASYYGCDQSQAQRELSAPTLADTKWSLVLNGIARFPLTLLYLTLGVAACALYLKSPELQGAVEGSQDVLGKNYQNSLVPHLILTKLPAGFRALVIAALLAAAMSSLDSALNSLSASTMKDFVGRGRNLDPKTELRLSKYTTIIWGVILIGLALVADRIAEGTVVEMINRVGSAFYGPILAAFLIGVLSKRATGAGVFAGVLAGVGFNMVLWGLHEADIFNHSFWWWNMFGMVVAVVITPLVSAFTQPPKPDVIAKYTLDRTGMVAEEKKWIKVYVVLAIYFVIILGVALSVGSFLQP